MHDPIALSLTANGRPVPRLVAPHTTRLDFLRDALKLKGTRECCAVGECGACTVIMDGVSVNACLALAVEAQGRAIKTVEARRLAGNSARYSTAS